MQTDKKLKFAGVPGVEYPPEAKRSDYGLPIITTMPDGYMTLRDTCDAYKMPRTTLFHHIKTGKVHAQRVLDRRDGLNHGERIIIRTADMAQFKQAPRMCRRCRCYPLSSPDGKTLRCPKCGLKITATGKRHVAEIWNGCQYASLPTFVFTKAPINTVEDV